MEQIDNAKRVLANLQQLIQNTIDDVRLLKAYIKIEKKLRCEIDFLEKRTTRANRSSSNLPYLYGVLDTVQQSHGIQQVIADWTKYKLRIDVMCDGGRTWKKVVARNPQSLHLVWAGDGQYGRKNTVDIVSRYLEAAKTESDFSPPNVVCVFTKGVTHEMAEYIETLGAKVEGERVAVSSDILRRLQGAEVQLEDSSEYSDSEEEYSGDEVSEDNVKGQCSSSSPPSEEVARIIALPTDKKVFLDVTTLVIYVSDVCNGGESFDFKDSMMAEQAEQERAIPVKPFIEEHFNDRLLVTCQAALDNYKSFMQLLGGKKEQVRAEELLKRVTVVPNDMSEKFSKLKEHGKIKERSKQIFGTADKLRCNILTSNESFLRAAAAQGVTVSAIVHQSRALSELKRLEESGTINKDQE
ncbi:UPF0415 protein C7orf25 homolog [Watersipora subatra]|uniref:UPF0415 protein C7orf25 homolog n=1 Tax=Watersipora subatra TaxID=2589382 RepID=UPI00355B55FE